MHAVVMACVFQYFSDILKSGAAALSDSYFGRGTSPALFHNILCNGDESSLEECSYSALPLDSYNYYYIYAVVGVICQGNTTSETECSSGDLRLVGGQSESEGRVEVCVDGFWGTVCDQNWSQREAIVACRQAGLPSTGGLLKTKHDSGCYYYCILLFP